MDSATRGGQSARNVRVVGADQLFARKVWASLVRHVSRDAFDLPCLALLEDVSRDRVWTGLAVYSAVGEFDIRHIPPDVIRVDKKEAKDVLFPYCRTGLRDCHR